jgi:EAL domain-containing protein (putative c-di-GMP-specific phosphodiesterase class I)
LTARHGILCVAEGVETQQQATALLAQCCHFAQGFLFSPALLPTDIEQMLPDRAGSYRGDDPTGRGSTGAP